LPQDFQPSFNQIVTRSYEAITPDLEPLLWIWSHYSGFVGSRTFSSIVH
jgi:hypothetical protein